MMQADQAGAYVSPGYRLARAIWRRSGARLVAACGRGWRVVRNAAMWAVGRADYRRWTSPQGLAVWWDERTELLARLIPAGSRVIEFGAGRRTLERLLIAGCTYIPSDLVDRGPGTIVCDLNHRPLPDLKPCSPQVAVFGGVLEYIRDVAGVARWLSEQDVRQCVASFDPAPAEGGLMARLRELLRRRYFGYMNNLTAEQFERAFAAAGFEVVARQTWTRQIIYHFQRSGRS
ncbi:methyltransferase domain-containing protein [Fontivita pretiosa]|uniref:methyltransferase domain-containing protein n=1 Tax=Fontivita pretiosa TaxID=2989684 RepID=UPI003D165E5F